MRLLGAKGPDPGRVRCAPDLQCVAVSVHRDAGQQRKKPDWTAPGYADPLPGVPAPGYEALRYLRPWMPVQIPPIPPTGHAHIYTEADRENLKERLKERQKHN